MRTLKLDTLSFIASPNEKKFILLRSEKADDPEFLETFAIPKVLNRNEANKIPGVWGTLGYAKATSTRIPIKTLRYNEVIEN